MSLFEKNIEQLRRHHAELADRLIQTHPGDAVTVSMSRSGMPVATVATSAGDAVLLASEYDPQKEAERFIRAQDLPARDACIIFGSGIGYHLLAILDYLDPRHQFLVVEQSPALLRTAFEQLDFTPLFASGRFTFFCGDDPIALAAWLATYFETSFVEDIAVVRHPPSIRLAPAFYQAALKEVEMAANRRVVDLATAVAGSEMFQRNIIANLVNVAKAAGVGPLKGALAGSPAIIVAAGPSLDKNIHLLKEAKGKALIVTVGTSLRKLIAAGVTPDVVVAMDATEKSFIYFDRVEGLEDVTLVVDPEVYPGILDSFPGARLIVDVETPVTQWLRPFIGDKGVMEKGRSVAHTAFYFARHLGCDPIAFVGLDLALTDGKVHADLCEDGWGQGLDPTPVNPDVTLVDAANGGQIPTLRNFLNFLNIFETEVAQTDALCIDATEGGALKRGMQQMRLQAVLNSYCTQERPISKGLQPARSGGAPVDWVALAPEVARVRKSVRIIEESARQGERLLRKITRQLDNNGYDEGLLRPMLDRLNTLHRETNAETTAMALIHRQLLNTRIHFETRAVKGISDMAHGADRLRKELERSGRLLGDTLKAAAFLNRELRPLEQRIAQEIATKS